MSVYDPYFYIHIISEDRIEARHNADGGIGFQSSTEIDGETHRLILLAIAEGERRKEKEIKNALGIK